MGNSEKVDTPHQSEEEKFLKILCHYNLKFYLSTTVA